MSISIQQLQHLINPMTGVEDPASINQLNGVLSALAKEAGKNTAEADYAKNAGNAAKLGDMTLDQLAAYFKKKQYRVGDIILTINAANPSAEYGGTWVLWGSGRVPVGVDTAQGEFNAAEKTSGAKTHTLSINEITSHTHAQNAHWHNVGRYADGNVSAIPSGIEASGYGLNPTYGFTDRVIIYSYSQTSDYRYVANNSIATNQNTGGSAAHNNLQPSIACYMWKKTA